MAGLSCASCRAYPYKLEEPCNCVKMISVSPSQTGGGQLQVGYLRIYVDKSVQKDIVGVKGYFQFIDPSILRFVIAASPGIPKAIRRINHACFE